MMRLRFAVHCRMRFRDPIYYLYTFLSSPRSPASASSAHRTWIAYRGTQLRPRTDKGKAASDHDGVRAKSLAADRYVILPPLDVSRRWRCDRVGAGVYGAGPALSVMCLRPTCAVAGSMDAASGDRERQGELMLPQCPSRSAPPLSSLLYTMFPAGTGRCCLTGSRVSSLW